MMLLSLALLAVQPEPAPVREALDEYRACLRSVIVVARSNGRAFGDAFDHAADFCQPDWRSAFGTLARHGRQRGLGESEAHDAARERMEKLRAESRATLAADFGAGEQEDGN